MALMRTYEPAEFSSLLSSDDLPNPEELSVVGMVKAVDGSSSTIEFTNSLSCENWLVLPIDIVDSFTHLRDMKCSDHEHPVVKVKFKRPSEVPPELAFLLSLCIQLQSSFSRALARTATGKGGIAPAAVECATGELGGQIVVCCWPPEGHPLTCTGVV